MSNAEITVTTRSRSLLRKRNGLSIQGSIMDESNENSMTLFPEKFSSYVLSRRCVFRTLGYGNTFDPQKMYCGRDYKENFAGYFGYEVKQLYIEFPK